MASVWIEVRGKRLKVSLPGSGAPASVDGEPFQVDLCELQPEVLSLLWTQADGTVRSFECIADSTAEGAGLIVDGERIPYAVFDPRSLRSISAATSASGPRPLKSPMPGRVVRVLVAAGEVVTAGQPCVVIEAMKMQNELKAPRAGTVARLNAVAGQTVPMGSILLVVE